ncbi:jg371, partial [Pararge aegeria aegeria]
MNAGGMFFACPAKCCPGYIRNITDSSNQSQLGIGEGFVRKTIKSKAKLSRFDLAKKVASTGTDLNHRKPRAERKKNICNTKAQVRRMNIACSVCKQKYPMLVPFDGCKKFVCSRCKKVGRNSANCSKVNARVPANMSRDHSELHAKTDLRGRS